MPSHRLVLPFAFVLASPVLAVGSADPEPPTPAETVCEEGLIFDLATETCLPPEESTNESAQLIEDVRRLAYEGRLAEARAILEAMPQGQSMVQTYLGFVTRKGGDYEGALLHYAAALTADPGNTLALSYRGMAHVDAGRLDRARADLAAIWEAGGAGAWPEAALAEAIRSGVGLDY